MTVWRFFWKVFKGFISWLFFTAIFVLVAGLTFGFRAYCPLESLIIGFIIVFILLLLLGYITGAWHED